MRMQSNYSDSKKSSKKKQFSNLRQRGASQFSKEQGPNPKSNTRSKSGNMLKQGVNNLL